LLEDQLELQVVKVVGELVVKVVVVESELL
jgi:hypothetical protein